MPKKKTASTLLAAEVVAPKIALAWRIQQTS